MSLLGPVEILAAIIEPLPLGSEETVEVIKSLQPFTRGYKEIRVKISLKPWCNQPLWRIEYN
jgi:hypothetical protein